MKSIIFHRDITEKEKLVFDSIETRDKLLFVAEDERARVESAVEDLYGVMASTVLYRSIASKVEKTLIDATLQPIYFLQSNDGHLSEEDKKLSAKARRKLFYQLAEAYGIKGVSIKDED